MKLSLLTEVTNNQVEQTMINKWGKIQLTVVNFDAILVEGLLFGDHETGRGFEFSNA